MKKQLILLALAAMLLLPAGAEALQMFSSSQVTIQNTITDDVIASGGTVDINAPVLSAVVFGGTVNVNAPISDDLIVAGGTVTVNSYVNGKIVAAGGTVDVKGTTTNLVATGGNVVIGPDAVITRDAVISGSNVVNHGKVNGNLTVRAANFQNTGSAGHLDYVKTQNYRGMWPVIGTIGIVMFIGALVLGIILLRLFPRQFLEVRNQIAFETLRKTVLGFLFIIFSAAVLVLLAISIVGVPLALFGGLLFVVALVLSEFLVAFALGKALLGSAGDTWAFVAGFIALNVLFVIPFIGALAWIIAMSLGYGAIYYALRNNWQSVGGKKRAVRGGRRYEYGKS